MHVLLWILLSFALRGRASQIVFKDMQAPSAQTLEGIIRKHPLLHDQGAFDSIDWEYHRWIAPGEDDLRSPCPGLNTLANHGFLPRDGRNITIPVVLNAAELVYNNPADPVLNLALKLALLTTDAPDSFTLNDLKLHGTIEHDASLSRSDSDLGDNLRFNDTIFSTLSESYTPGSTPDLDSYDPTSVGKALEQRLALAKKENPELINTIKERQLQLLETSLFLSAMGDPITGIAPKKFVQIFFREERLPLAEGWSRPVSPTNSTSLMNLMAQLGKASQNHWPWLPHPAFACPWTRLQPEGPVSVWPPKL
ncbi:hypothetical protein D9757_012787 [Collybiopsis confluens]|uniref:Heme haloperoxidase family profile domain-containing protein n=1 Tax=Collybiopsis confluens TaxID=2823264 RepID=A0A8H5CUS4_9AGAR|nr:hypothetical protein D9757_012787 [Collybiopsis confluens]